jgi:hypothetical protein
MRALFVRVKLYGRRLYRQMHGSFTVNKKKLSFMRALYSTRKVIWAVPVQLDARNKNLPFMRALYCTRKVTPATPIPPDARKCYFFLYLCTACRLQKAPETRCSSPPSSSSHFASRCGDQPSGSIHLSSRHPIYPVK